MEQINLKKYEQAQEELAKQLIIEDEIKEENIKYVAGVDVSYQKNNAVAAAVLMDYKTFEVVEKKVIETKIEFPYIPSFLAFREGPPVVEVIKQLSQRPDVILVDGNGIAHERKCGLACYVGFYLDIPTIGVAKNLLAGIIKENKIIIHNELRGYAFQSRTHSKPIYISPGHKISPETSLEVVKHLMKYPHKTPEPLHISHRIASTHNSREEI